MTCVTLSTLLAAWNTAHAQQPLQSLQHHVRPEITSGKAALISTMPPDQQINATIVLPLRNQQALNSLLSRLYDPSSHDYRHFFTVAEFTEQFGPTVDDYQAVVSFAQANGLTVTGTPANRLVVPISGTVAQINQAFNVQMNVYQHPIENRTFFSPDREPTLNLSVPIAHIVGLNNFSIPRPMLVTAPNGQAPSDVTGSGPGGSYLASDMRAAYYGGTTLDGNGQAVGLLEFDGYYLSDVNSTFSSASQTYSVPINNVLLDGQTGAPTVFNDGEDVLDIVQAIGMAPGLSQVRVYIGGNDADILNSMASENIAKQLSCSWSWIPDDPTTDDPIFQEMAAQGQSFFAASGDYGAYDLAFSPYFYPQEDAYITAVGGTHLITDGAAGAWVSESSWNDDFAGSGGGISPDGIAIPSWQAGLATSSNGGSSTVRNVPDVAMEGDFDNYICSMGSCFTNWAGTSFAAPRWAGFMALINQQAVEAGTAPSGGLGFINPSLYSIGEGSSYTNDMHDVVQGNNDTENQPTWFSAVAGYDLVTGWGSANGQNLIDALAGPQVPGFWILASSSTVSLTPGGNGTATINVTDAGGFSGNVTLAVTSTLPTGVTASWGTNPTSGSSVLTLTASSSAPAETSTLTISGVSGSLTATTNVTVAVHTPTFALSAAPNSLAISQGSSGTSTITVTPEYGFTGNVNLSVTGLPTGVTASWGTNPTSGSSVLTLTVSNSAPASASTLTITGTSGSITTTTTLALAVQAPSFTLSSGGSVAIGLGSNGSTFVFVNDLFGFNGSVNLSVSGLPSGVTASFSPNPTTSGSTLTLTASSTATVGNSTLTVTGTSGSLTATTTVALSVNAPSFTLSGPVQMDIGQGSSNTGWVYINSQFGFTGSVTLSVSGLPSGVTALWNPNPASGNSQLTLTASNSAPVGQYTITVSGKSGALSATTTFILGVHVPTFTLSGGGSVTLGQGTSTTSYVYVYPQYGFTGSVNLSVSGLPSGVTASFSPNPTTSNTTLTLTASSTAATGQYTLTITGTSGGQTATTTLSLGIFAPTFTISSYGSVTIGQGTSSSSYVFVNPEYGFTGSVNLSVSGLPSGVTASFSPNPTTGSSQLTLTASSTAATGQYTATITGKSGTQTATTTLSIGVYVPTFTISAGSLTIGQGTSATSYINIFPQYGFSGNVNLSVSGLPSGVTASFSPNPTTYSSTLTFTASSTATLGQYNVTITGTSGSQTVTTTLTLGVYVPTFALYGGGVVNLGQGTTGSSYVTVYPQYGFNGNVNLTVSGLPSGVTASFSPNPTTSSSNLTLTASSGAATGQYTLTITGTSGTTTASTTLTLGVYPQSFTIGVGLNSFSINEGATDTGNVYVYPQYGFSGNVTFSATNLPNGVTATFSPNPTTGNSVLTLAASDSATPGTTNVIITGTSGSQTASTTFSLTVNTPSFTIVDAPSRISLTPGASDNSTIIVLPQNGFAGDVSFAATGLPSGVTASFSPNPATGNSTLTLKASDSASTGTANVTITGTAGTLAATAPLALTVRSAAADTSTTLTVTSSGKAVTSVASGTPVTLTAAVKAGSTALTTGQINFCDATATYCDEIHRVGSAQLTDAETAALTLVPGMGSHSYKAVFAGTNGDAVSSSSAVGLAVTASTATTTTIAQSGDPGDYTLTATVTGQGLLSPTGTVSFVDTSNSNSVLGSASLSNTNTALSWVNSQTPATATAPSSVVVGDFNGDGIPDVAVTNSSSNNLTILLGNGDGTFTASSSNPSAGTVPFYITSGDFNRDGKTDLVVINVLSDNLTILLGNGDGTFTATASNPPTSGSPDAVAVADLNGDGIQDLAVADPSTNTVTILLDNGDGTFTPSALAPQTGSNPKSVVAGDFNGDGIPDLAVANYWDNTVSILLGNGDGTFVPIATASTGYSPNSIAIGDFNGDGKKDLAVANSGASTLTILLGNGDGTFTAASNSPQTGSAPQSVVVGDFNGDGKQDLAVANEYGNNLTILLGNGDGTFTSDGTPPTGSSPLSLSVGDFNGDGIPDLIVANYFGNTATVLTSQLTQTAVATANSISPVGTGTHNVDASYPGDSSYKSSVSTAIPLTGTGAQVAPTVTVSLSSSTISAAQALTATISVSGGSSSPAPTGAVSLTNGSYSSSATSSAGTASLTIPAGSLPIGTDTLTASFTPDAFSSSLYTTASGTASVTVTATAYSISATPLAVSPGNSGTSTITVSSTSGYAGTVGFTCAVTSSPSGASDMPTCSASQPVTLSADTTSGTATVTVNTTPATSGALTFPSLRRKGRWSGIAGGGALALLVMFGIPRQRRKWLSMICCLFATALLGALIACGGGGGSTSTPPSKPTTNPGTTPGSYTITVAGTGNDSAKTTATTTFTLTVN